MLWAFFLSLSSPKEALAGFFDSILRNEVFAVLGTPSTDNSQSQTTALQPNIPYTQILQKKESAVDTNINIVSDNSFRATASPQTAMSDGIGGADFSSGEEGIEIYVVKSGDTAQVVADMFEISVDTVYSANNMKKGDKLSVGDVLLILPFSGVEHTVVKGETMQSIANKYKIDLKDILGANDLHADDTLAVGERLMIPGGDMLAEAKPKSSTTKSGSTATGKKTISTSLPSVSGYFKNPVPGARRTRGLQAHHHGVDLAAPTGTPIHAAAGGTVIIARMGYNGGFGNYVVIQHSNGTKTLYAHMSKLGTTPGAKVSQGEVIGYVGNTGNSRGAHLHIEVLGGKNPF